MRRKAFTLVELLVVIGIIAVLISVLLPALTSARKQAATVKCAAALREIGSAFNLYSGENKGYFPVAQYGGSYNLYGDQFPASGTNAYWPHFLAKYVTKTKFGTLSTNAHDASDARKSILWGCTEFEGYRTNTIGEMNRVQNGLGMNPYPTFKADITYTVSNQFPPVKERAFGGTFSPGSNFQKQNLWKPASEKAVVADSRFWMIESCMPPDSGPYPPAVVSQENFNNSRTYTPGRSDQTMIDIYRHGKYPKIMPGTTTFDPRGGKIAFNILYADGHVATATDGREAYRAIRMKFPG